MLPLAGATAATAAAVTMLVLPVGTQTRRGACGARRSTLRRWSHPRCPSRCASPSGQPTQGTGACRVFGDSVAWTLMRYLPPTPGLTFTNYTTIGCGVARGGPYRYIGQTLNQKPECDAWPSRWSQRINHDRPDVVLLIIGRWEVVDRINEGTGRTSARRVRRVSAWRAATGARHPQLDRRPRGGDDRAVQPARREAGRQPVSGGSAGSASTAGTPCCAASSESVPTSRCSTSTRSCARTAYYTNKVDGIKMRRDGVHPTPEAVKWLTPWLTDALKR